MYTLAVIIQVVVSLIIIVSVLLQVGKGSDMGSAFGGSTGSQTVFGAGGPASLLAKITAVCAAIFMITSLYLTYRSSTLKSVSVMSDVPVVTTPAVPVPDATTPAAPVPAATVPVSNEGKK